MGVSLGAALPDVPKEFSAYFQNMTNIIVGVVRSELRRKSSANEEDGVIVFDDNPPADGGGDDPDPTFQPAQPTPQELRRKKLLESVAIALMPKRRGDTPTVREGWAADGGVGSPQPPAQSPALSRRTPSRGQSWILPTSRTPLAQPSPQ